MESEALRPGLMPATHAGDAAGLHWRRAEQAEKLLREWVAWESQPCVGNCGCLACRTRRFLAS